MGGLRAGLGIEARGKKSFPSAGNLTTDLQMVF
jgi:hypothetical protein